MAAIKSKWDRFQGLTGLNIPKYIPAKAEMRAFQMFSEPVK